MPVWCEKKRVKTEADEKPSMSLISNRQAWSSISKRFASASRTLV